MRRKALLIGDSTDLHGVPKDIRRFRTFLMSLRGGAWCDNEIELFENKFTDIKNKNELTNKINEIKNEKFDYVIVLFCGHGSFDTKRSKTLLYLNKFVFFNYSDLICDAKIQLNIFDCCRRLSDLYEAITTSYEKDLLKSKLGEQFDDVQLDAIRTSYNDEILKAEEGIVTIHSCTVNEYAHEDESGGIFLNNFLQAAQEPAKGDMLKNGMFIKLSAIYEKAKTKTKKQIEKNIEQGKIENGTTQIPTLESSPASISDDANLIIAINFK